MNRERRGASTLQRIARVRQIEHLKALDALAETSAEHSKLGRLHQRSLAIAGETPIPVEQSSGAALTTGLIFRGQLHALAQSTRQLESEADTRNHWAQQQAGWAKLRLQQIEDRARDESRKLSRRERQRSIAKAPVLARQLLVTGDKASPEEDQS